MKQFWFEFKNSFYGPAFYRQVIEAPLGRSLAYYFKLISLLALAVALLWTIALAPAFSRFVDRAGESALQIFPAELELRVAGGVASSTPAGPIAIAWPESFYHLDFDWAGTPLPTNLAIIDTQAEFSEALWEQADALVLVTRQSVVIRTDTGIEIRSLQNFGNFTLNRAAVERMVAAIQPWTWLAAPAIFLAVWLASFLAGAAYLLALLIIALLVWLLGRLKGVTLTYGGAYRVALRAATTALVARALAWLLVPGAQLYFLPTILLLLVAAWNLKAPAELVQEEIKELS